MVKQIKVRERILDSNEKLAKKIKLKLKKNSMFAINVMASPGAGKTSLILETIRRLKGSYQIGVIDGDVVEVDVDQIKAEKVPVVLANTGGACHLDAVMVDKAVDKLNLSKLDLLIVENVGNLICPMHFAIGTDKNIVIASVPEGDDKPEKYPAMFFGADVIIINKMDYLSVAEFDMDRFTKAVRKLNAEVKIFPLSCKTKEGIGAWINWLKKQL